MSKQRVTYTTYSIGCAGVWGAILTLGRRRLDTPTWGALRLVCGWWIGWTSATIARAGFPPARPLTPTAAKRLRAVSVAPVALGLTNVGRMLVTGKRATTTPPDRRAL